MASICRGRLAGSRDAAVRQAPLAALLTDAGSEKLCLYRL